MKNHFYIIAAILIMTVSAFTAFRTSDWKIDEKYSVKFDGGDPAGEFRGLKGTISFDAENLAASKFDVSIDVASINTGNGMKYPVIKFTSTSIAKTTKGFEAKGMLDMHGVQKEISLPFTFFDNVFTGGFEVNRLDYNINTEEPKHGAAVLKVTITVPVSK